MSLAAATPRGLLARLTDRLNPVLVKEVRQALRGRLFLFVFNINLSVALVTSVLALVFIQGSSHQDTSGRTVFQLLHAVYAGCAFFMVPLMANRGMAAERDGHTLDGLLVSGLTTSQIVLGKWLGSIVILMLFLSANTPFLALGYALYGLDILSSLLLVVLTTIAGVGVCLLGILMATLVRNRALDTMLLGLQVILTLLALIFWIGMSATWLSGFMLRSVSTTDFLATMAGTVVVLAALYAWFFALCVSIVAHPEENASRRLRLATLNLTAVLIAWCVAVYVWDGPSFDDTYFLGLAMGFMSIANIPLVTERDTLTRRAAAELTAGRWRRPWDWLLLPGGGRGFVLYLGQVALILALAAVMVESVPNGGRAFVAVLAVAVVAITFLGYPARLAGNPTLSRAWRIKLRFAVIMLPFMATLFALLLGMLLDSRDMSRGETALNPFYVMVETWDGDAYAGFAIYAILAAGALILNVPRMVQGRREVVEQRRLAQDAEHADAA